MSLSEIIILFLLSVNVCFAKVVTTEENVSEEIDIGNKSEAEDFLIAKTPVGKIKGLKAEDGDYKMFLGVPYGKVNESNPFGLSTPYPPFNTTFEAYSDKIVCPHREEFNWTIIGSLECLNLNIFVPYAVTENNLVAVMVYIYGGRFRLGRADRETYGPKYLVRHNVIVVTVNFRIGAYGYMCLDTPEVPGNQGQKDQVLAFRWIKKNIKAFGGDPDRVTVFGNSAGAISIGLHLISETEHLFENAILQSGSAFVHDVVTKSDLNIPFALAKHLGFETDNLDRALTYLRDIDVKKVVEAQHLLNITYTLCLEKSFPNVERFLAKRAINTDHTKRSNVTIMTGYTTNETLFHLVTVDPQMKGEWSDIFKKDLKLNFDFSNETLLEAETICRHFYIGDKDIGPEETQGVAKFDSDISYIYSTIRSIKYYLNAGTKNVYQFEFAYDGQRNYLKKRWNVTAPSVNHADELGYLFKMDFFPDNPTIEDQLIIDRLTLMWTNFAKYR